MSPEGQPISLEEMQEQTLLQHWPEMYDAIVSGGFAPNPVAAQQLVRKYLVERNNPGASPYTLPELGIKERYIDTGHEALKVSPEARGKVKERRVLVLGGTKPGRIGREVVDGLRGREECPRFILHYLTSEREAEELQQELGERAIAVVDFDLGNSRLVYSTMKGISEKDFPDILLHTAAPYDKETKADLAHDPELARRNYSGIFMGNIWAMLPFALRNRGLGRKALAGMFSDWLVETPAAYEEGFGLYPAVSYFTSKGGLEALVSQLRITSYDKDNERVTLDKSLATRVNSYDEIPVADRNSNQVLIIEKIPPSRPIPALEELTFESMEEYIPVIEEYLENNLWNPMIAAAVAVNEGKRVYIVFPDSEIHWLDTIILKGVRGIQEVFESDDLQVSVIAPGPTLPWPGIKPEELAAVASRSLIGWSGAGQIFETTAWLIDQFSAGNMHRNKMYRLDSGRGIVAEIERILAQSTPTPRSD